MIGGAIIIGGGLHYTTNTRGRQIMSVVNYTNTNYCKAHYTM